MRVERLVVPSTGIADGRGARAHVPFDPARVAVSHSWTSEMLSRRDFIQLAAAIGASLAWGGPARASRTGWRERRDLYPEGVASGDPDPHSVILWTRRPFDQGERARADRRGGRRRGVPPGRRACARAGFGGGGLDDAACSSAASSRRRTYWYRFTDADGNGSRIGRTITAPAADDPRTVNFAFVSCQSVNEGTLNALSPDDLRGRARGAGRPARFRAAPRRLHLRGRPVSRRR